MSKNRNKARINCFLAWLEDFKKVKPKTTYKAVQVEEQQATVLIRQPKSSNSFRSRR